MIGAGVGGYTCSSCGMFVTHGSMHSSLNNSVSQIPTDPTWPLIHALGRVETELRRIADTLEAKHDTD